MTLPFPTVSFIYSNNSNVVEAIDTQGDGCSFLCILYNITLPSPSIIPAI